MNKITIFLLVTLVSNVAFAGASLEYPLVYEKSKPGGDYSFILLSTLNSKLKAKSMEIYPDRIKFSSAKAAEKQLDFYDSYTDKVSKELGMDELFMVRYSMGAVSDLSPGKSLCYSGVPADAVALINSLASIGVSDQQGMLGWRYKKEKHFADDIAESEIRDSLPKIWKEWKGKGEAILYLWHETDDGTDVNTAIVPKCE